MIVVNSRAGQRSNRLVTIAHALATAIERGEELRLTAFGRFARDYRCDVTWGGRVVIGDSLAWELVRLVLAAAKRLGWRSVLRGRVVSDWSYRAPEALERQAEAIRAFFAPARTFADLERAEGEAVVGVHKRRGDYRQFLGGRYYFEDDVYEANKAAVRKILEATGRKVRFVEFPRGEAVEDQWLMSRCDYLIGPPSSFSAWASFMGRVPLGLIWSRDSVLAADDLRYRGLYV